jgi:phage protein D
VYVFHVVVEIGVEIGSRQLTREQIESLRTILSNAPAVEQKYAEYKNQRREEQVESRVIHHVVAMEVKAVQFVAAVSKRAVKRKMNVALNELNSLKTYIGIEVRDIPKGDAVQIIITDKGYFP